MTIRREELGEPVGDIEVLVGTGIRAVRVEADELPLVIDEVPVLAAARIACWVGVALPRRR